MTAFAWVTEISVDYNLCYVYQQEKLINNNIKSKKIRIKTCLIN